MEISGATSAIITYKPSQGKEGTRSYILKKEEDKITTSQDGKTITITKNSIKVDG